MSEFSQLIKKAKTDEWYTQEENVSMIIPYLLRGGYKKILCPFDNAESNFVKVLKENGFEVSYSHIEDGIDFFNISNLSEYDAVVSNPPFSKRDKIFERLFDANIPFALIMNMNGLFDSKTRWKLFKENDFEILVPQGRMKFFNENCGVDRKTNSPNFQSIYLCKGMSDKQIDFIE